LQNLVATAEEGLKKRNFSEEKYLEPMMSRIQNRKNPADVNIELFRRSKKEFLDHITYKLMS